MGALHRANLAVGLFGGNHIHPLVPSTAEVSDYSALAKRSPSEWYLWRRFLYRAWVYWGTDCLIYEAMVLFYHPSYSQYHNT